MLSSKTIGHHKSIVHKARRAVAIKDSLLRELLAEFGCTFLFVFLGTCNVAQFILTRHSVNSWLQVNMGWGFAVTFAVYAGARTSGSHINPAITLMIYSFGLFPLKKLALYSLMQVTGAFVGATATYFFYLPLFDAYDGGVRKVFGEIGSAAVFTSFPAPHLSHSFYGPYVDQIVVTAVLGFLVCLIVDERNEIPKYLQPLMIGFSYMMIGTCFAANMGYPINPARDFGPRLFALFVYGSEVFTHPYPTFWIAPLLGPLLGGPIGGWIYYLLFGLHLPAKSGDIYRIVSTEMKEMH